MIKTLEELENLIKTGNVDKIIEEIKEIKANAERSTINMVILKSYFFNDISIFQEYLKEFNLDLKASEFIKNYEKKTK